MLRKHFGQYILTAITLLLLVAAIQTGAAIYFWKTEATLQPADLVVVFPGEKQRITTGLKAIKNGSARRFMLIGSTQENLQQLLSKNNTPPSVSPMPGGKSRSTFEDVYQTVKTIKENQLNSVILVSSSYHLPRALFLLKVYLTISGHDIHIQAAATNPVPQDKKIFKQHSNEMIKFWGSFLEMTGCCVTGTLMLNFPAARKMQMLFKKHFLWR